MWLTLSVGVAAGAVAGAIALARRRRPSSSPGGEGGEAPPPLTTGDKACLCVDRLMAGRVPVHGQLCIEVRFEAAAPSVEALRAALGRVAEKFPRLRQVGTRPRFFEDARFVDAAAFEVRHHVVASPGLALETLANMALPGDRPLWRVDRNSESTIVFRLSHALGDGLRLLTLARDLLVFDDGTPATVAAVEAMRARQMQQDNNNTPPRRGGGSSIRNLWRLAGDLLAAIAVDKLPFEGPSCAACFRPPRDLFAVGYECRHVAASVASMAELKTIRASHAGATLNDVILTAFCAAADAYARAAASPPFSPEKDGDDICRALIAVSLPSSSSSSSLSETDGALFNDFVLASADLPVFQPRFATRAARLASVMGKMGAIKRSAAPALQLKLAGLCGRAHLDALASKSQLDIFRRHAFVYSNLPGFDRRVHLCGRAIEGFNVFFPNCVTQLLFFTYNGRLSMNISTDPTVLKDPKALAAHVADEIADWARQVEAENKGPPASSPP